MSFMDVPPSGTGREQFKTGRVVLALIGKIKPFCVYALMCGDASKLVMLDFFSLCFSVFSNFPAMNTHYLGNREIIKTLKGSRWCWLVGP